MGKIVWLLLLIHFSLYAESNISIEKIMIYKTDNPNLTVANIHDKQRYFQSLNLEEKLKNIGKHSWLLIKLHSNLPSGKYLVSCQGVEFTKASFSKQQLFTRYIDNKLQLFTFKYNHQKDSQTYYLKLIDVEHYKKPYLDIQLFDKYYQDTIFKPDSKEFYLLFGIVVGFMFMVSSYNLAIFYFHHENSFFYYAMMQLFMIFIMIYQFGIVSLDTNLYNSMTLISSFFATLFMRSFLDTATFLPKLDKVLLIYLLLLILDFVHLNLKNYSLVSFFGLYSIFGFIYFLIGFLRLRQGFIPARFFLIGWSLLVVTLFLTEHVGNIYGISPFLFGPPLEAILLSLALAHRLKLILNEKKEQQDLLVHQSKLASMGEMIGNIAHQWKQPLTYLSYNFMNLREASSRNLLDDNYLKKKLDKAELQLAFMSQTIDNFKDFYLPHKTKESFSIEEASLETVEIISYELENKKIEVEVKVVNDFTLNSYKNEYKQVLLNLLTNAKDNTLAKNHPLSDFFKGMNSPKIGNLGRNLLN